jgi:hypothetical protein
MLARFKVNAMKIKDYKNGYATFERLFPSGMYLVQVYKGSELADKIRCDSYKAAMEYFKAFAKIAKNA